MNYKCNECGLKFKDEQKAKECEEFCKKHKACNPELNDLLPRPEGRGIL